MVSHACKWGHGKPGLVHALADILRELRVAWRLRFSRNNSVAVDRILEFGPHPSSRFVTILERLKTDPRIHFLLAREMALGQHRPDKVNVVLRHDLDSQPENLSVFTNAERQLNLRSSIYVRADGDSYPLNHVGGLLRKLKEEGFEIGLHTAAYCKENSFEALKNEMAAFQACMGTVPASINTHGVPPSNIRTRLARRRFLHELWSCSEQLSATVTDHNQDQAYDYLIGDANKTRDRSNFLTKDILEVGSLPAGRRVLFMTHPEYWIHS